LTFSPRRVVPAALEVRENPAALEVRESPAALEVRENATVSALHVRENGIICICIAPNICGAPYATSPKVGCM
jgi:hypothetical protein